MRVALILGIGVVLGAFEPANPLAKAEDHETGEARRYAESTPHDIDWPEGGEAKDELQLTLKPVKSTYEASEKIELKAKLSNLSDQEKTVAGAKQMGFTLYNPQFDLYISGTGNNGTQYMNMMGFFGGDKNTGTVLAPNGSHMWDIQESTRAKMVSGTAYGKELPPGQYKIYAEGVGLKSNKVEIAIFEEMNDD